jgi:hypothetical protein
MKKGQITIFVILAIVIVAGILFFFLFRTNINGGKGASPDLKSEMQTCVDKAVEQIIEVILPKGGMINPGLFIKYEGSNVEYLCYSPYYYTPCINRHGSYVQDVKEEIRKFVAEKADDCLYKIKKDYAGKGYSFDSDAIKTEIELKPGQVRTILKGNIEIIKNEESYRFSEMELTTKNDIYNMAVIAEKIANQESKVCYFNSLEFNMLYPNYKIEKLDKNADTKIYSITNKKNGKILIIAIRSCALIPGI